MPMKLRQRLPSLLLAFDWLLLVVAFSWTCKAQHSVLWWLRLDWGGWLAELGELAQLGTLSAGTLWILWLAASVLMTGAWLLFPATPVVAVKAEPTVDAARKNLAANSSMIDTHPELKEKILRLHQSLEKI